MKTCLSVLVVSVLLCLGLAGVVLGHPLLQPRPPEGKHFMLREYPDAKGLYEISYQDLTLTECMEEIWEHAAAGSIGIVPKTATTARYLNNVELFMLGEDLAHQFERFYHAHGDICALVDDRLKPLMTERLKETDIDQTGGEIRLQMIKDSEVYQLAASLTTAQLVINQSNGIPLDKLTDEQRKRVELLTQYRQVIDPFDTRTVDKLDNARLYLYLVPSLRFKNVKGYPDLTGWASYDSRDAVSSEDLKTRGIRAPVENALPDQKLGKEVTVAESGISLRQLLQRISTQTGVSVTADSEYNSLMMNAYCKGRAIDVLSAISDVTGLGWDKRRGKWVLCANEWAKSVAEWRIKYLWVRFPGDRIVGECRKTIRGFVDDRRLPAYADDAWLSDDRLYSLTENKSEISYAELTDGEKAWMASKMRIRADITQLDEAKLLQDMTEWGYAFSPVIKIRVSNERGHLYSDWLTLE